MMRSRGGGGEQEPNLSYLPLLLRQQQPSRECGQSRWESASWGKEGSGRDGPRAALLPAHPVSSLPIMSRDARSQSALRMGKARWLILCQQILRSYGNEAAWCWAITRRGPEGGKSWAYFSSCSVLITVGALGVQPGCAYVCTRVHLRVCVCLHRGCEDSG